MNKEIQKLLSEGIIEEIVSTWRAQLVVVKDPTNCKKKKNVRRLLSNNKPTYRIGRLPLPRSDKMINDLAKYKVFSFIRPQNRLTPGAAKSI